MENSLIKIKSCERQSINFYYKQQQKGRREKGRDPRREDRAPVFSKPKDSVLLSKVGLFEAVPYHCPPRGLQIPSPGRLALWAGHRRLPVPSTLQGQGAQDLPSRHGTQRLPWKSHCLRSLFTRPPRPRPGPWHPAGGAGPALRGSRPGPAGGTGGARAPEERDSNQGFLPRDSQTPTRGVGLAGSTVPRVN